MKEKLTAFAEKFQSNIYVKTMSSAMTGTMALMMISSIASLLLQINIGGSQAFMKSTGIAALLTQVNNMTINLIAVYIAFLMGYRLADVMGKDKLNAGIMSLMSFLILTPIDTVVSAEGVKLTGIAVSALGSQGMFSAMIAGLIGARLYILLIDKKWTIKLPESVPSIVSNSFAAIVPGFLVAILFGVVYAGLAMTPFGNFTNLILGLVQKPLMMLGNNIFTVIIMLAFAEFLWFLGIHGSMATMSIMMLLYYQPHMANLEAFGAGQALPFLITYGFIQGNKGARPFAVSLYCLFKAKSEQLKAVGKVAVIPSLFGLSEPLKFGIPQVMNIRMLVPLVLCPVASFLTAYFFAIIGFLPYHNGVSQPLGSPIIVSAFFSQGWQGVVVQLIQLVICILIYIPFMAAQDKACLAEEAANTVEA